MHTSRGLEKWGAWFAGRRSKWITLLGWIIVTALLSILAPTVNKEENNNAALLPSSAPSVQAQAIVKKEFPSTSADAALVVWYRKSGLTERDLQEVQKFTSNITARPVDEQGKVPPLDKMPQSALKAFMSKDGTSLILPIGFSSQVDPSVLQKSMAQLNTQIANVAGQTAVSSNLSQPGLHVRITGPAGISADAQGLFKNADVKLLAATTMLVLILLILLYRSPLLALVPLISVGFAYSVTSPLLGLLAKSGMITVDAQGVSIMTVLLFGAGTDYCLFLVSRYRELLTEENDKHLAIRKAVGSAGGAVAMSGLTVVISLLTLLFAKYGSDQRFAIPFSLSIFVMVLTGLTLVPALLAIFGRSSFFPIIPRTDTLWTQWESKKGRSRRLHRTGPGRISLFFGRLATRRPWPVVVFGVVVLAILASFATQFKPTYDLLSSFPKTMPSREGYQILSSHFSPGQLAPVQVVVQDKSLPVKVTHSGASAGTGSATAGSTGAATATSGSAGAATATAGSTGVASATSGSAGAATATAGSNKLASSTPEAGTSAVVTEVKNKLQGLPFVQSVSAPQQSAVNGQFEMLTVDLKDDPYSIQAMNDIPKLQAAIETVPRAWISGITATQYDTMVFTDRDTKVIIPMVIGIIALLLLVYLRSIVAMVYLMATVLLSYFSALGIGWIVLHYIFGASALAGAIPLYAFVFLVALGEDYNIFMVSRIWQSSSRMSVAEAVMEGTSRTSSVITSAGLILAGTFAVLTALPLQILVQFGTVTAIGVLIDTFIVRPLVVPSLTRILGRWSFWPSRPKWTE